MSRRGPAPLPTKIKELKGNPGRRPLNNREAHPDPTKPRRPSWIQGEARREWDRVVPRLHDAGLLTSIDHGIIEAYCVVYGRWVEAEKKVKEVPAVVQTSNGNPIQNPYISIANHALADLLKFAREFGMTPSARSRIPATPEEKEESLADFLFGGK